MWGISGRAFRSRWPCAQTGHFADHFLIRGAPRRLVMGFALPALLAGSAASAYIVYFGVQAGVFGSEKIAGLSLLRQRLQGIGSGLGRIYRRRGPVIACEPVAGFWYRLAIHRLSDRRPAKRAKRDEQCERFHLGSPTSAGSETTMTINWRRCLIQRKPTSSFASVAVSTQTIPHAQPLPEPSGLYE
jgi:hypothetical protein